jgi:tetratricopeptide (TPR) repeat protein
MKKGVIGLVAVVALLFAVITLLKVQSPESGDDLSPDPGSVVDVADRERVRRFWELYRQATDHRVAGRTREAARDYARALELDDEHEDALYYLGSVYLDLGEAESAERLWRGLLQINDLSARAHSRLGSLYACVELAEFFDLEAAEAEFRRALEINTEETGPLVQLGQIALLRGDITKALGYFEAVIGSDYTSVDAYFFEGYIAWKEGETQQAHESFARAVSLARPTEPADGMSREGDTRAGSSPMVLSASRCRGLRAHTDDLRAVEHSAAAGEAESSYRRLDRFLDEVRRRLYVD